MIKSLKKTKKLVMALSLSLALLAPSLVVNAADSLPFPYDAKYPYGVSSCLADSQSSADTLLKTEWESWKSARITTSGARGFKRVQRDTTYNYDTVSEGMGYGLLLSAYFGDQELFDSLYGYVKTFLNSRGLLAWQIDKNGNIMGTGGGDAATDADEDIALALVMATKKWGTQYESEAKKYINNLYNYMVEKGTYIIKPGDTFGGTDVTNPCYFSPAWYRVYADFTGNTEWDKVADKCYEVIDKAKNSSTGLVPDWCTGNGGPSSRGSNFGYDAIRYPWRTAIDYSWFGTAKAKTNCDLISNFFKNIGVANIKDGYTLSGSVTSNNHCSTYVACIAAGTMTGSDTTFAKNMYNECVKVKDVGDAYSYYGNTLRLLVLLFTTGNFPNPLATNSQPPVSTTAGDLNSDKTVDSIDFALLKKAILNQSTAGIDSAAADMNNDGSVNAIDLALLKAKLLNR